jgi:hypothetical protein
MSMPGGQCSRETDPYTIMLTQVNRFTGSCRMPAMLRVVDSSCQFDASTMPYQLFDDTHVGLPLFLYIIIFPLCLLSLLRYSTCLIYLLDLIVIVSGAD